MDKNDILDYVTETPGNTNRAVLSGMLNSLDSGGGEGSKPFIVNVETEYHDKTGDVMVSSVDKTYAQIKTAIADGQMVVADVVLMGDLYRCELNSDISTSDNPELAFTNTIADSGSGNVDEYIEQLTSIVLFINSEDGAFIHIGNHNFKGNGPFLFVSEIVDSSENTATLDTTWNTIRIAMRDNKIVYVKDVSNSGVSAYSITSVYSYGTSYYVESPHVGGEWYQYITDSENGYPSRMLPEPPSV